MNRSHETNDKLNRPIGVAGGEVVMETVSQTMTGLVVSLGLLLVVAGAWALLHELVPVALQ